MLELFKSLTRLTKVDRVSVDNVVFRLHYKVTFLLFVSCSILVTAKQFFGEPIACIVDEIPKEVMNSYCWIESTFTIPGPLNDGDLPYPGVKRLDADSEVVYHKYYQWVCFFLFAEGKFHFQFL